MGFIPQLVAGATAAIGAGLSALGGGAALGVGAGAAAAGGASVLAGTTAELAGTAAAAGTIGSGIAGTALGAAGAATGLTVGSVLGTGLKTLAPSLLSGAATMALSPKSPGAPQPPHPSNPFGAGGNTAFFGKGTGTLGGTFLGNAGAPKVSGAKKTLLGT